MGPSQLPALSLYACLPSQREGLFVIRLSRTPGPCSLAPLGHVPVPAPGQGDKVLWSSEGPTPPGATRVDPGIGGAPKLALS